MNTIVNRITGRAHIVGDISEDDLDEDGHYVSWTYCGTDIAGKLHRRGERTTFAKMCKRCFNKRGAK